MSNDKSIWDALNTGSVEAVAAALENPVRFGHPDGIVNLSEAIELAPLTEAITKVVVDKKPVSPIAEREAFEAAIIKDPYYLVNLEMFFFGNDKEYVDQRVEWAWNGWLERASRG